MALGSICRMGLLSQHLGVKAEGTEILSRVRSCPGLQETLSEIKQTELGVLGTDGDSS